MEIVISTGLEAWKTTALEALEISKLTQHYLLRVYNLCASIHVFKVKVALLSITLHVKTYKGIEKTFPTLPR